MAAATPVRRVVTRTTPAPIVVPSPVIVPTPVPSPRGTVVGWIIPTVIRISPSPVPVVPAPIGRSPSPTEIEVEVDRAGRSPCAEERRDIFGFDPYFVAHDHNVVDRRVISRCVVYRLDLRIIRYRTVYFVG